MVDDIKTKSVLDSDASEDESYFDEAEVEIKLVDRVNYLQRSQKPTTTTNNIFRIYQNKMKRNNNYNNNTNTNSNSTKTSFLTKYKKTVSNFRSSFKEVSHDKMSYNGGVSGGLEDPQNSQSNNWPFSVRYTASPYRKSKYPPASGGQEGPALPPHLNIQGSASPGGLGHGSHPWNGSNHQQNTYHQQGHPFLPSSGHHNHQNNHNHYHHIPNSANINSNTNSGNLQKYLIAQQEAQLAQAQQQFNLNNPLAYQNHFVALKQHQLQQQQLLQQRQRQYDHHHYGLPVSAMPHGLILHHAATTTKTLLQHQQPRTSEGNSHFQMRYPSHFPRNRVFHLNDCNSIDQTEGLDEGYIEDLKQTPGQPTLLGGHVDNTITTGDTTTIKNGLPSPNEGSSSGEVPSTNPHTPGSLYDPYSYVYDSPHAIKEDLSVCSASVNQVFLNKRPLSNHNLAYPSNYPYPYPFQHYSRRGSKVISSSENEYEEIRDVQRYMNSSYGKVLNDEEEEASPMTVGGVDPSIEEMGPLAPKHFKSFSTSTDDILAEVVQVQQKHDRVLDQLNLEVENLLLKSSKEIAAGEDLKLFTELKDFNDSTPCSCNNKGCSDSLINNSGTIMSKENDDEADCNCPSCDIISDKFSEGSGYSTLVNKCGGGGNLTLGGSPKCNGGGTLTLGSRKKKLDRSTMSVTSSMDCNNKVKLSHSHSTDEPKAKSRYQRTYSLIPNWKIRDHLMRLPFLKHHHDKLKKGETRRGSIPASISSRDFASSALEHTKGASNNKLQQSTNNIMTTTITESSQAATIALGKTRASSMDELRSTEEHWYSADSDTEPDSLMAVIPSQSESETQPVSPEELLTNAENSSEKCCSSGNGSVNAPVLISNKEQLANNCTGNVPQAVNINNGGNKTLGNLYSNCTGDQNGSRMDIGSVIHDVPKAPKFRRGTGLKDKWRESWSSHSKTLLKSSQMEDENRLLRWFSLRKNSASLDPSSSNNRHSTLPQLTEEDLKRMSFMEDEEGYWPRRTVQPPTLPPPPSHLSNDQITRRHIIAAIVHSENNYVAALQRLVNEYKKPLEGSHPAILSHSKTSAVFHRLPEILQCHSLFRIALAECVRRWDAEEKIGDVFVASFSKSLVLDVYSEFINNFGNAMETAKVEARRKSAFAEFLKVKQMTAHDRLSLFGLMVKPVQRFPQFILLLQDLLKHTPKDHHDRMSLQLALTQLESLAAMLNERKRESEQYQAFRETIKSIGGGKFVLLRSIVDDPNRILLRQDLVTQLEFDNNGGTVAKSKCRKLLLLNDMLICTTVNGSNSFTAKGDNNLRRKESREGEESNLNSRGGKSEKSVFKWSFPVRDVEVEDISISPTMSRFVHRGSTVAQPGGLKSSGNSVSNVASEESVSITLLEEMQSLMHDYEVLSRILGLVSTLKSSYEGLTVPSVKELMLEIQHQIRCRDEQISYFDSSCLTLILGSGNSKEKQVFQMQSPEARSGWIEELRLAQLALDPNNSPAWDIPQESPYPHHKLPLFVRALALSKQPHLTTVKCGCFFTHTFVSKTGRSKILDYLWVSSTDGMSSHITAYRSQQNTLKEVNAFDLVEEKVNDILFVQGHIWVATESRKIMMYDPGDLEKGSISHHLLSDSVLKVIFYDGAIYAGLADGTLAIFTELDSPENLQPETQLKLGSDKIISLFGSREHVYAACGNAVVAIHTKTHTIERSVVLNHHNGPISHMTCSGVGLWITTQESGTVCLYHLESFQHLQDVSIAPSVYRTVRDSFRRSKGVYVTCLTAHKGWLWIGTNLGVVLTIPLPRLEGVPIISTGNANVSYHGYCGPVTFLMPLMKPPVQPAIQTLGKDKKNIDKKTDLVLENSSTPSTGSTTILESTSKSSTSLKKSKSSTSLENSSSNASVENSSKPSSTTVSFGSVDTPDKSTTATTPLSVITTNLINGISDSITSSTNNASSSTSSIENNSPGGSANKPSALVVLRKKSSKDNVFLRNCKTLPRGGLVPANLNSRFSTDSDVYGLYGNLINVRGLEDEGRFVDPLLYEALRRSDPELNALDAKISTLDRRLKMRMSRPRSLDLSNWSVDSKISASSDESVGLGSRSSHTTDGVSSPISDPVTNPLLNPLDPAATSEATKKLNHSSAQEQKTTTRRSKAKSKNGTSGGQERTVLVVVGGRGYLNMRTLAQEHFISSTDSESKSCPYITLWQMKT